MRPAVVIVLSIIRVRYAGGALTLVRPQDVRFAGRSAAEPPVRSLRPPEHILLGHTRVDRASIRTLEIDVAYMANGSAWNTRSPT
jgi:hypothetical protein